MASHAGRKRSSPKGARTGILTDYLRTAMRHAIYEKLEDGTYWGEIPGIEGVWADEKSLEECREELQSVLESWILFSLVNDFDIPPVDGIELYVAKVH